MFGGEIFIIIVVISLMIHAFDAKYLLVKVEEQRNEFKGNQSTRRANSGFQIKKCELKLNGKIKLTE